MHCGWVTNAPIHFECKSYLTFRKDHAPRKRILDSPYPIFWVEAFNIARQRWVSVDPFATPSTKNRLKFEPPASDPLNDMSYAIAFNEDGTARDVTLRYAKAYNAKTRRRRVESTPDGERWWKRALAPFTAGSSPTASDQIEDSELANLAAQEPMPRNIQDFKDHPVYALERHLRRNQIIHPKIKAGQVDISNTLELVYRRSNVLEVKSADKWLREGREIKVSFHLFNSPTSPLLTTSQTGEQPLKYATKKRRPHRLDSPDLDDNNNNNNNNNGEEIVSLYAPFQTRLYVPIAIMNGAVPRNQFGNIDLYVPSMIPPGGVHIPSSDASSAARIVGIDFANAVTGFQFKGRQGTAITRGVVVAREYQEAVESVVQGLRWQREDAEAKKQTKEMLRLWKRFWTGLKIRERIMSGGGLGERIGAEIDEAEDEEEKERREGGFFLDKDASVQGGDQIARQVLPENAAALKPNSSSRHYYEPSVVSPWDDPRFSKASTRHRPFQEVVPASSFRSVRSKDHEPAEDMARGFLVEGDDNNNADDTHGKVGLEDMGGGFIIIENDEPAAPADKLATTSQAIESHKAEHHTASGFLLENDEPDPTQTAQFEPDLLEIETSPTKDTETKLVDPPLQQTETENEAARKSDVAPDGKDNADKTKASEDRSDDDDEQSNVDSMPSHDPSDDDAEPDWLADAVTL